MKSLIAIGILFLIAACSHVDTGQIDYRIADRPIPKTHRNLATYQDANCNKTTNPDCTLMQPSRVLRRYMPETAKGWAPFRPNSIYSIDLEQGMIGENTLEGMIGKRQFGDTAEIAILANVFEFAAKGDDAATHRFLDTGEYPGKADDPSDVELKLVYFSDDIRRHQALNFSNIPLRPRGKYNGGSIGIQIVIMEVDTGAGPMGSLMKTLAKFGQQALPVPGEVKDILFDLGESLLTGGNDDKLFDYRFVLSAAGDNPSVSQATFVPGRYVLRRTQNREIDADWAKLLLDNNTGRLMRKADNETEYKEERKDLYLVLNVKPYKADTEPEFYQHDNWSNFRSTLQAAADAKTTPITALTGQLQTMLGQQRSGVWREDALRKWSVARDRLALFSDRYVKDFGVVSVDACGVSTIELRRRADVAERDARDAVRDFVISYREALERKTTDSKGQVGDPEISVTDRERVTSTVAGYFMPWTTSKADGAKFADAAIFDAHFISKNAPGDLAAAAIVAAGNTETDPKSCDDLLAH